MMDLKIFIIIVSAVQLIWTPCQLLYLLQQFQICTVRDFSKQYAGFPQGPC